MCDCACLIYCDGETAPSSEVALPRGTARNDVQKLVKFFQTAFVEGNGLIHFRAKDACNGSFKYKAGHFRKHVSAADSMKNSISALKNVPLSDGDWVYVIERDMTGNQGRRGYRYIATRYKHDKKTVSEVINRLEA